MNLRKRLDFRRFFEYYVSEIRRFFEFLTKQNTHYVSERKKEVTYDEHFSLCDICNLDSWRYCTAPIRC